MHLGRSLAVVFAVTTASLPAGADTAATASADEQAGEPKWNHVSGSSITLQNSVSVISFAPDHDPDYNPMYGTGLNLAPRWAFNEVLYAYADFSLATELTRADWTNDRFYVSDVTVGGGAAGFYVVPRLQVALSVDNSWRFPTSYPSRAASLRVATDLVVKAARKFPVRKGLTVALAGKLSKSFHRYSTASPSHRILDSCTLGVDERCAELIVGDGTRHVAWGVSGTLASSFAVLDWLSLSMGVGIKRAQLYALGEADARVSNGVDEPTDSRHFVIGSFSVSVTPLDYAGVTLGVATVNQELAPDGTHRRPFINRYTSLSLDLHLDIDHFVHL